MADSDGAQVAGGAASAKPSAPESARKPKPLRQWVEPFLAKLEETMCVADACRAVKIHRETAYGRRRKDAAFAKRWDEITTRVDDLLEASAMRRAIEGASKIVFHKGQPVTMTDPKTGQLVYVREREYETGLTIFMLKKRRPDKYGDEPPGGGVSSNELAAELRRAISSSADFFVPAGGAKAMDASAPAAADPPPSTAS